jgi:hypothetical protein
MLLNNLRSINKLIFNRQGDFKEKVFHILKTKMVQLGFSKAKAQHVQSMMLTKEFQKVLTDQNYNQMCSRLLKYLIKTRMIYNFKNKDLELLFLKIIIRIVKEHHSLIQLIILKILTKNLKIILQS